VPDRSALPDKLSFIAGDGEMARRIRGFDWSAHPFGPPETWPQSLRSALGICLHSAFPTAIYWGPELRLLYNDAWAPIPGPRHPAALGKPAREVWADIWDILWPQFRGLLETGEGFFAENQLLPMRRYGFEEETYWNYSFSAIRGEDGRINGIFNCGYETTETVLGQRRLQFMLSFSGALHDETDAAAAIATATEALGEHLRAAHVGYCEPAPGGGLVALHDWAAADLTPAPEGLALADFGAAVERNLARGQAVRIDDVEVYCRTTEAEADCVALFAALQARAGIIVPCVSGGRLICALYVLTAEPRRWAYSDILTLQEALERARDIIAILRNEQQQRLLMREVDHRAKNALAVVQAVVRLTEADSTDAFRRVVDGRIAALARAHELLAESRWEGLDLESLVRRELGAFGGGGNLRIEGPLLRVPPEMSQTVALALHELATNAAKYGALRDSGGALSVTWQTEDGRLLLDWRETTGRPITPPQGRSGFGTELLNSSVRRQSGGEITFDWADDGLKCRLVLPLEGRPPQRLDGAEKPAGKAAKPAESRRPRLLLAEDEALVAMDLQIRLDDFGFQVVASVDSVAAALEAVEAWPVDAAVLDANLHGESSLPVAIALHRRGIPVLFITGYDRIEDLPEELAGAERLSKPVADHLLRRALAALFPASAPEQSPAATEHDSEFMTLKG
jgi:two-component sensor histidine kinase/ActR/RegA family two-component response regulator